MLRLMGLLLLFSSCALFGARRAEQLGERARAAARMMDFWRQFALQLECLRSTPTALVQLLAAQQEFSSDPFFTSLARSFDSAGSFQTALGRALRENPQLERSGIAPAIAGLGDVVGVRELDTQLAAIASVVLTLDRVRQTAQAEYEQKGGLYRRLGVMAGILVVVILF